MRLILVVIWGILYAAGMSPSTALLLSAILLAVMFYFSTQSQKHGTHYEHLTHELTVGASWLLLVSVLVWLCCVSGAV